MPAQTNTVKRLTGAAALVGALGLGGILAFPSVGLAQTDSTTTTVVEDTSETTVADESSTTEPGTGSTTDESQSDRPKRGDGNCDHDEADSSSSS
jgi:uncharacterized low-complexity protein